MRSRHWCVVLLLSAACGSTGSDQSSGPFGVGSVDWTYSAGDGDGDGSGFLDVDGGGTGPRGSIPDSCTPSADDSGCVGEVYAGETIPLDMYVIQDHTASMGEDCPLDLSGAPPARSSKWCFATHALAQFFMSDSTAGIRAALQFMSVEDFVCEGGPNNGEANAAVGLTMLPVNAGHELVTSLDADAPLGGLGTRIEAALHGIADYTANNRTAGREMIGILITDGDPNGCDENVDNLATIISDHLAATGIRTFIIGMTGATLSNLETMAVAGGAPEHSGEFCGPGVASCHYWSVGDGDPVAFVDALRQIQAAASIPCEFNIPPPPEGETLNYNLVNIGICDAAEQIIVTYYVNRPEECDAQNGGWYYDDPDNPQRIQLCEASCDTVSVPGAQLFYSVGCETQTVPIE